MKKLNFFLFLFCIFLLLLLFKWIHYLVTHNYIYRVKEFFDTKNSYSVNLFDSGNCKNKCSPTARCYLTGQQCFADLDCPGCHRSRSNTVKIEEKMYKQKFG